MARHRDPHTGKLLMEGIHPQVSARTGAVTYRARVSYGPKSARRHKGKTFKHASQAEAWLLATKMEVSLGTVVDAVTMTCAEYFAHWYGLQERRWSAGRALAVSLAWSRNAAPVIGAMKLQAVGARDAQRIVDDMTAAGLKSTTIEMRVIGFKSMFAAAVRDELIRANPFANVMVRVSTTAEKPIWSALQLQYFLEREANEPAFPLWALLIGTSCRIGEAIALQWDDIDVENHAIWFRRTVASRSDAQLEIVNRTKSGKEGRTVAIDPWVLSVLLATERVDERVLGVLGPFQIAYRRAGSWLDAAAKRAGLPRITPHGFRHASATAMAVNGVEESIVQDILGHRSRSTTRRIYVHIDLEAKRKGATSLAKVLGKTLPDTTTSPPDGPDFGTSASEVRQISDDGTTKPRDFPRKHAG